MNSNQYTTLDDIRALRFRVWRAVNRKDTIPKGALEDCFRSFGFEVPFCELHRKTPDLGIVLNSLEIIELSLSGVNSW